MKILIVHNYYQQPGGEDTVFAAEMALLKDHGHDVIEYTEDNHCIIGTYQISLGFQTIWSRPSYNHINDILRKEKPDLVHFHNTFPLISPAAYYACRKNNIPVVQSLDNPRLICPAATFYRNGSLCLDCLGKTPPLPGIIHGCYHNSRMQTLIVAFMLTIHRWLKTWQDQVDAYLVATEFYRNIFIEAGLPSKRIYIKPHFIRNESLQEFNKKKGEYLLFIGRLDPEKGVRTLLEAWKKMKILLIIRGDGRLDSEIRDFIKNENIDSVKMVPRLSPEELDHLVSNARFLIWPSEGYYETFGMVAVECFSHGIPVVASNIGVMAEIVTDNETGLLFKPGDPVDLASKVEWLWNHPDESTRMGLNARKEYEEKYTAERNCQLLIDIYSTVLSKKNE